jgi:hypothetical protein
MPILWGRYVDARPGPEGRHRSHLCRAAGSLSRMGPTEGECLVTYGGFAER